jgi:hypothetical protein
MKNKKLFLFTIVFFVVITIWWISLFVRGQQSGTENDIFTSVYGAVAFWGGIAGLVIAKKWGGFKSILGKAFGSFALGLLAQFVGQICYSYYIIVLGMEVPYPSIGDFAFFSTGFLYAFGSIQLIRSLGIRPALKTYQGRIGAILIPLLWAFSSYFFFLRGYVFDWSSPVVIILDLASPIIDGVYISLIILVYLLSKKFLGGIMKFPVLFLMVAVFSQAIADYVFIFRASREMVYSGGVSDYIYLLSYTLMTIALMYLGFVFKKLTDGSND